MQPGAAAMAEGSGGAAAPACRLGGAVGAAPAPGRQCCVGVGGCGLGLARLVRRLRRRGRRALCAAVRRPGATRRRQQQQRARQYDPLSYARNFDIGDADAARVYHGCSFSSRFVLVPNAAASAGAGAAPAAAAVATS